jgi:hypothetical protein
MRLRARTRNLWKNSAQLALLFLSDAKMFALLEFWYRAP